jgi:hypothetical protein
VRIDKYKLPDKSHYLRRLVLGAPVNGFQSIRGGTFRQRVGFSQTSRGQFKRNRNSKSKVKKRHNNRGMPVIILRQCISSPRAKCLTFPCFTSQHRRQRAHGSSPQAQVSQRQLPGAHAHAVPVQATYSRAMLQAQGPHSCDHCRPAQRWAGLVVGHCVKGLQSAVQMVPHGRETKARRQALAEPVARGRGGLQVFCHDCVFDRYTSCIQPKWARG